MQKPKGWLSRTTSIAIASCASLTSWSSLTQTASAQAAYGSYIGVGATYGINSDDRGEGEQVGGSIAIRYKLLKLPFSLRTQALIGESVAVVPTISYDIPLGWQTDLYLGVGAAFASGDKPSPVGDKTSFAVQPGLDFAIPHSGLVLFGNGIIAFDAYRNGGGTAVSVQGGLGLRF
jgi:hypothetical protein